MHAEKEDKEASILGGWLLGGLLCGDWWVNSRVPVLPESFPQAASFMFHRVGVS